VDVTLHVANRKDVADLRADAGDARTEAVKTCGHAEVVGHLLKVVSNQAKLELLLEEMRRTPVEVKIDAVLILGVGVLAVGGCATNPREFVGGLEMEVSVTAPEIDSAMPNS